jgi:hypothetical protein
MLRGTYGTGNVKYLQQFYFQNMNVELLESEHYQVNGHVRTERSECTRILLHTGLHCLCYMRFH